MTTVFSSLGRFLAEVGYDPQQTELADCPLKTFVKTGVFPTSIFHIHSPTAIPNNSHKHIYTAEKYTCPYYKVTLSNNYFKLFMHICIHKVHKDQHWGHQTTSQRTVNMHTLNHPLIHSLERIAPLV